MATLATHDTRTYVRVQARLAAAGERLNAPAPWWPA